jgi:hypothetical protein
MDDLAIYTLANLGFHAIRSQRNVADLTAGRCVSGPSALGEIRKMAFATLTIRLAVSLLLMVDWPTTDRTKRSTDLQVQPPSRLTLRVRTSSAERPLL